MTDEKLDSGQEENPQPSLFDAGRVWEYALYRPQHDG